MCSLLHRTTFEDQFKNHYLHINSFGTYNVLSANKCFISDFKSSFDNTLSFGFVGSIELIQLVA